MKVIVKQASVKIDEVSILQNKNNLFLFIGTPDHKYPHCMSMSCLGPGNYRAEEFWIYPEEDSKDHPSIITLETESKIDKKLIHLSPLLYNCRWCLHYVYVQPPKNFGAEKILFKGT